jgi:hypothetical protein
LPAGLTWASAAAYRVLPIGGRPDDPAGPLTAGGVAGAGGGPGMRCCMLGVCGGGSTMAPPPRIFGFAGPRGVPCALAAHADVRPARHQAATSVPTRIRFMIKFPALIPAVPQSLPKELITNAETESPVQRAAGSRSFAITPLTCTISTHFGISSARNPANSCGDPGRP